MYSRLKQNSSPNIYFFKPRKLTADDKTKSMFEEAIKLGADDKKGNELLKKIINEGQGPYAALAVFPMCTHIDQMGGMFDLPGQAMETKEKYLEIARKKDPLIGFYMTAFNRFNDSLGFSLNPKALQLDGLQNFFVFENYINKNPKSYEILGKFLKKGIDEDVEKIDELLQTNDLSAEEKEQALAARDEILKGSDNPKDFLKLMMTKIPNFDFSLKDELADAARKAADQMIEEMEAENQQSVALCQR